MTAPLHSSEWLDEALHLYLITAKMRTEGDYWNDPAFKKAKQAIQEALVEARIEQTKLIEEALVFGKDINEKTWYSFDIKGYFRSVISDLEADAKEAQ